MLASAVTLTTAFADGTGSNAGWKGSSSTAGRVRSTLPETRLVGISLYDTGLTVIQKFGSPDQIQGLSIGGSSTIGAAGGAPTGGGPGGGGPGGGGAPAAGGGAGGASAAGTNLMRPTDWGATEFNIFQGMSMNAGGASAPGGQRQGGDGRDGTGGGGAGAPAGGGDAGRILYTRWVYKRGNSRFGFILDKFNKVIQIEAVGTADSRVYTNRGIKYGSQVKDIITRHGAPDAYEITGDQIVMRYLIRDKVAFRLNRLKTDKPHVVTGIVVAAGKA